MISIIIELLIHISKLAVDIYSISTTIQNILTLLK